MKRRQVIVDIDASRVAVRVMSRGVVQKSAERRFDRSDWPSNWESRASELSEALGAIVQQLGVRGLAAVITYSVPGTASELVSSPVALSPRETLESARLAVESAMVSSRVPSAPAAVLLGNALALDDGLSKRFAYAYADSEETLSSLSSVVEKCGLKAKGLVPTDALGTVEAVDAVTRRADDVAAACWIGNQSMVVAVARRGALLAVRHVSIGMCSLADSLTRPIQAGHREAPRLELSRTQAWTVLSLVGLPTPDDTLPVGDGLRGEHVLPALQPILQRLAVEIKQLIRFEVEAGAREEARLGVLGAGAMCNGLEKSLCRLVGVEPWRTEEAAGSSSPLQLVATTLSSVPLLIPQKQRTRTLLHRVRTGAVIGAALALAASSAMRSEARSRATAARAELAKLHAVMDPLQRNSQSWNEALQLQWRVDQAQDRLIQSVGAGPSVPAVVRMLADACPRDVVLTSADVSGVGKGDEGLVVAGYTPAENEGDAARTIQDLVHALKQSPLVHTARLNSTQRASVGGRDVRTFLVTGDLVGLSARSRLADVEGQR